MGEIAENVAAVFKQFDSDGDGTIGAEELTAAIAQIDPDLDMGAILKAMDVNRDGMVQYLEFVRWVFGAAGEGANVAGAMGLSVEDGPGPLSTFLSCFPAWERGAADRQMRANLWNRFDPNGNGYVSLAEADAGIEKVLYGKLGADQGIDLWRRYRPAYIRAFNVSKDIGKEMPIEGVNADTDDYVTKREFRLFICFLRYYCEWFEVFALVDGNSDGTTAEDDRRISAEEWAGAVEKVQAAGSTWAQFVALQNASEESFGVIDADGKGMVLLAEFCEWVKSGEIENGTAAGESLKIHDEDVEEHHEQERCNRAWKGFKESGAHEPTVESMSGQLEGFLGVFNCAEQGNDEQKAARADLWRRCDPNGNGYLSLAEVDGGIRAELWGTLGEDVGTYLWRRYRPAYIRAFNDAKDIAKEKPIPGANADTDDYVTLREFRLFVCFLRYYCIWFEVFSLVDGENDGTTAYHDRRLSREEWSAGVGNVAAAGASWAPFLALQGACEDSFDSIDANGKGKILLIEFCSWVKQAEVDAGTPQGVNLQMGDDDEAEGGR